MANAACPVVVVVIAVTLLAGCSPAGRDTVMSPGMRITATNDHGTIAITAGDGLHRTYAWDGNSRSIELTPRRDPHDGLWGAYSTGEEPRSGGETAIVARESVLRVPREWEFTERLAREPDKRWVYTHDGLVVGFRRAPQRNAVEVDVFQLLIGGRRPQRLAGARDAAIRFEGQRTREAQGLAP